MYAACTICMRAGDYVRSWIYVPLLTVINLSEELIDIYVYNTVCGSLHIHECLGHLLCG